jgi:hypothetical protein
MAFGFTNDNTPGLGGAFSKRSIRISNRSGFTLAHIGEFSVIIECSRNDFPSPSIMICAGRKSESGEFLIADEIRVRSNFN